MAKWPEPRRRGRGAPGGPVATPKTAQPTKPPDRQRSRRQRKQTKATEQAAAQGAASPTSAAANGVANIDELAHFRPDLAAAVEALQGDLRKRAHGDDQEGPAEEQRRSSMRSVRHDRGAGARLLGRVGRPSAGSLREADSSLRLLLHLVPARVLGPGEVDLPALGRYSSSDPKVIRRQIELAKLAGLSGFIVSWKSTRRLNRRLASVVRIANEEHFKLALIYEGLDFKRNPLPASRVESDLVYFRHRYGRNPAFNVDGKPIVIWSGTWRFSRGAIAAVSRLVRPGLLLLASEKSVTGYRRMREFVDGDAYYWSSRRPAGRPLRPDSSSAKCRGRCTMPRRSVDRPRGSRVRRPPDRRQTNRPRLGGGTLRAEWSTALASSPDLIGVISWNEYSENSEIEPTAAFGTRSSLRRRRPDRQGFRLPRQLRLELGTCQRPGLHDGVCRRAVSCCSSPASPRWPGGAWSEGRLSGSSDAKELARR